MSAKSEEMESSTEPRTGLTVRSLIIALVILLLWGLLNIFSGNFGEAPRIFIEEMSILFPFFLLIFGLQALERIRIRGAKLSRQELTFIWAMLIVGIPITNSGFLAGRLLLNAMYSVQPDEPKAPPSSWSAGFADFWAPPVDEILRAIEGGTTPDFGDWLIPLAFWGVTCVAWAFMCLFLIQIFRKPWVDVERLAFPLAQPVQELLEAPLAVPEEKKNRYFWLAIGALLGIAYSSLEFLRAAFPEWGDILEDVDIFGMVLGQAWAITIDFGKEIDILGTPLSALLPNAQLVARPEPVMIAAFLLVSLNVLLSGLIFWLFFWVLIPVGMTELGIIDAPASLEASPPYIDLGFARGGGISLFAFGEFGMLFGVVIWAVILQRRYLWRSIQAIWNPSIIDESGEPISYRAAWIGLLVCAFIFFSSLLLSGSPLIMALYTVIFLMVGYVAGARLRAETAGMGIGHPGYLHLHGMHTVRVIVGEGNAKTSGFYVTSMWMQFFQRDAAPSTPAISSLEAYNIARITNTRTRDIFVAHSIGIISIILLCLIAWPIFAYSYGLANEWSWEYGHNQDYSESTMELARGGYWDHKSYEIDIWGQAILGMVFAIGLNILRLSRPWLPLNPVAAPIILSLRGPYWWLPMLIAYLIKLLVVRIGGTRWYTSYLLPGAVGYLVGTAGMWGYSLLVVMIPLIFPFVLNIGTDIYDLIVLGIWVISILTIISYLVLSFVRK
ncbi:MAG: hypothetical protein JSV04_12475 [Candidatus Heimdallarchaeota archaeon]|nr:MAG: hypothetical protein JSV04_12475 [Candidatus Heimdallarchaeota archaeon]